MVTIWFEPHSTSLDNEAGLASGWNDVDLSELGTKQSIELAKRCEKRGIDAIFCSDLQRAVKSVVPFANQNKLPVYVDERLRECHYGDMTQASKKEVDAVKLLHVSQAFPNGESYVDCVHRMRDFLQDIKEKYDGKTVLVVGHRATQYSIENYINGKPLPEVIAAPWHWQPGWKYLLK